MSTSPFPVVASLAPRRARMWFAFRFLLPILLPALPPVDGGADGPPPRTVQRRVVVTPARTETPAAEGASSVAVLDREALSSAAALSLDDALKQVPGFSLFRRTPSRAANPTAQGVSLRGLGASGASRALVLADGAPLNDPFGGWVYWDRVPKAAVDRVEVMQGGASDLYGSGALGGVVNLVRRPADASAIAAEASYGARETRNGSLFASRRLGSLGIAVSAEAFRTDGYVAVDPGERGPVDTPVASSSHATEGSLRYALGDAAHLFSRASYFDESRDNGTPLQTNDTRVRDLQAGGERATPAGSVSIRVSGGNQTFRQSFSAIAADRASERLTGVQNVATSFEGASAEWRHDLGRGHVLLAGADWRLVRGTNDEARVPGDSSTLTTSSGRQEHAAFFAEDLFRLSPRLTGTLAVRVDSVLNSEGAMATATTAARFPDRSESLLSPRLALAFAVSDRLRVGGSVGRSFRSPTLNELYRSFRVGNIQTLANENLVAEKALGGDVTARANPTDDLSLSATLFFVTIEDPVANVTLQTTPALITRQRRNLGRTRSSGVEVGAELRLGAVLSASAGYTFVDSRVTSFPADGTLEGRRVPQVPRHQATLQVRYEPERVGRFGVQARFVGDQFDDDQNRLRLSSFFVLDLLASRPVAGGLAAFVAVENLFDRRYDVGRTPVLTVGPPRLIRGGLRFDLGN